MNTVGESGIIRHLIALQYAHKPGIAGELNSYMAEQCKAFPDLVCGMATVYPGEDQDTIILAEAFAQGLGDTVDNFLEG